MQLFHLTIITSRYAMCEYTPAAGAVVCFVICFSDCMYGIGCCSALQLAMKFLEKDELSNYTFQNDFMRPFVVVMRQSQVGPCATGHSFSMPWVLQLLPSACAGCWEFVS